MSILNSWIGGLTGVSGFNLTADRIGGLISATDHSPLLTRRRALVILSRIRFMCLLGAFFYVAGFIFDITHFDAEVTRSLLIYRATAAFLYLALLFAIRKADSLNSAYRSLFVFFATSVIFQALYQPLVLPEFLFSIQGLATAGYAIFPFLICATIAVFPLTIKESFLISVIFLTSELIFIAVANPQPDPQPGLGMLLSLGTIVGICTFSAVSQMSYMLSLVEQASVDSLTNCYSRNSGEEILDVQFRISSRQNSKLSVVFLDLDNFKSINDRYGHEAGDRVLQNAANNIRKNLRDSDVLIRWGGEEFLMILPYTDGEGASMAIRRMRNNGFGKRPDKNQVTASIGIAELTATKASDWQELVDIADEQMYLAKTKGKDQFQLYAPEETPNSNAS
ncbi:diguanylate cyclase [Sneathiella sp. P13V-1]|uniref:GGDEF domain-containing protein n=1 Tax=Sneathiella sp. P13V-1 TaxID=2697366 RepID=UPI00187BA09E|nr:GGDEF domain-containing protein [Sneathiella sp. P13V-1]MBE7635501.1 diguanylate cyclase [Sneathiella sp. P13V-1]